MVKADEALLSLLAELKSVDYRFVCVTPATHERILSRQIAGPPTLRDVFGWNRWFTPGQLPTRLIDLLELAESLDEADGRVRSRVRVASLGEDLFLHSSYPTALPDTVFFGPDTYRFARFISHQRQESGDVRRIIDMGAGTGAGGIVAARAWPRAQLTLVDINPAAARLATINARFANVDAQVVVSDKLNPECDLVIANPPYMVDVAHRTYRDGGGTLGGDIALDWVLQALRLLPPGGCILLYTGVAVVGGRAPLLDELQLVCSRAAAVLHVEEIDPDVFGEELDKPEYAEVERIAAVGIRIEC